MAPSFPSLFLSILLFFCLLLTSAAAMLSTMLLVLFRIEDTAERPPCCGFEIRETMGGGREEEGENVSERESQCGKLVKREKPSLFLFLFLSLQLLYSQGTSRSRPETAWKGQGRSFVFPFVF